VTAETLSEPGATDAGAVEAAYAAVAAVVDPEIQVVSIADLGILRDVSLARGRLRVTITPTYSGCPAMDVIRQDIRHAAAQAGHTDVEIITILAPAWTTDWISESGRAKLAAAGIAPPGPAGIAPPRSASIALSGASGRDAHPVPVALTVRCPRCGSPATEQLSAFSSTACKALWRCRDCAEPFDAIKAF
jgi:ring-1,2-phenylacetyl-CoA epoxidase subunit PaaD